MSTRNTGSRRPPVDTTQAPLDSPQHGDAAIDLRIDSDPVQAHAAKPPSSNLLLPRSRLIGRDHEVAAVQHLLLQEEVTLFTLTGPGGVGKTRLALQVAANLLDHFVDGVYFVSLAPITDTALVIPEIAQTLGLHEAGGRPFQASLQDYLQQKQMLLVLDNFEQVAAAAPSVAALLTRCRRLKVLVTSRATLHLYGEHEFSVPPLALPDANHLATVGTALVARLTSYAAVELFLQRALAVKPDFTLTIANAAAVAEICIRLDGLPLAIELAAAKIKLFSPPALLAQLKQRLTLLTGGPHDLPARQRTLRNEIAWSYDLLAPSEQALFRRLSVFMGGFTLEASQAVCNATGDLGVDVLDGIAALVDQNLIKPAESATFSGHQEPRFGMLETIREFGLEQLETSGEIEAIRRQHATFFLALAEAAGLVQRANQAMALAQWALERDNLRLALAWSVMDAAEPETALRLTGASAEFWITTGYWSEGRYWSEAALARTTAADRTAARAQALAGAGGLAIMQGDQATALAQLEEALEIASERNAKQIIRRALVGLSWIAHGQHDDTLAITQLTEALAIARELEDKFEIASTLIHLGGVARSGHDYGRAQHLYEEGLALFQEVGAVWDAADSIAYLGLVAQAQNNYNRADTLFRESLTRWRALGTLQWKGVADCLEGLASMSALQRRHQDAARLFGAAEMLREVLRGSPSNRTRVAAEEKLVALRAHVDEAAFAAAWAAGRALWVEEAVDYALALPAVSAFTPVGASPVLPQPVTYPAGLTPREVEVLRLLAQGLTYAQIAEELIISRRTVNGHVTSIYSKFGVTTRAAATRLAMEHHLL